MERLLVRGRRLVRLDEELADLDALFVDCDTTNAPRIQLRPTECRLARRARARLRELRVPEGAVLGEGMHTWSDGPPEVVLLLHDEPAERRAAALDYLDTHSITLGLPAASPRDHAGSLFLLSIPKSGTHLLYELASALGYRPGIVCPAEPRPGHWYCVEYSNSHTVARDFFVDTVRRSPFGNRHHPFPRHPALFIYRNPLDILVSEAHYYHREGNTIFAGYLEHRTFEERLLRLVDDPWLLGTLRERIGGFLPWLDFGNVIPLSFEELVGEEGGGRRELQEDLIWSLQLKLGVDGRPGDLACRIFDTESPTFHTGRIGAWRKQLTPEALAALHRLPRDYMEALGFALPEELGADVPWKPARAAEFRRRPLRLANTDFSETPIIVASDVLGFNIVRFRNAFVAVPLDAGPTDLTTMGDRELADFLWADDVERLKLRMQLAFSKGGGTGNLGDRKPWPSRVLRLLRRLVLG